jgi:hypothetical protein
MLVRPEIETLFKPAAGDWIFSAPNPWMFARRRQYLVDDLQKADLAQRIQRWRIYRPTLALCSLLIAAVVWSQVQQNFPLPVAFRILAVVSSSST